MESHQDHIDIADFQEKLLGWYEANKRELPWRKNQDPYRIWVSEVMLQQTKVDTVIPYFQHFMKKFPTATALAEAAEEEVLKSWEGLGYYSRARNLHAAVKEVKASYNGEVPRSKEEFSSLKGVGPYTTGAVLSIAYDQQEPAVDGNVMRVFSRLLFITDDISKAKTRKIFESSLRPFLNGVLPSQFNQAVMELGAMVCTPKSPGCLLCPVQEYCKARVEGVQDELPVKAKKKAPSEKEMAAVIVKNNKGQTLYHQRGDKGLLARLWEYPNVEIERNSEISTNEQIIRFLRSHFGLEVKVGKAVQHIQHVFSHIVWNIAVVEAELLEDSTLQAGKWMKTVEAEKYTFPVSHKKILQSQKEREE